MGERRPKQDERERGESLSVLSGMQRSGHSVVHDLARVLSPAILAKLDVHRATYWMLTPTICVCSKYIICRKLLTSCFHHRTKAQCQHGVSNYVSIASALATAVAAVTAAAASAIAAAAVTAAAASAPTGQQRQQQLQQWLLLQQQLYFFSDNTCCCSATISVRNNNIPNRGSNNSIDAAEVAKGSTPWASLSQ